MAVIPDQFGSLTVNTKAGTGLMAFPSPPNVCIIHSVSILVAGGIFVLYRIWTIYGSCYSNAQHSGGTAVSITSLVCPTPFQPNSHAGDPDGISYKE